jgi:putative endonuclease
VRRDVLKQSRFTNNNISQIQKADGFVPRHDGNSLIIFYLQKMQRGGTVYIMTNIHDQVFYTGVTSDLISRISEHKEKVHPESFTAKYNILKLVYFQAFPTIEEAIAEEKRIKGGNRSQKIRLISSMNPEWKDLFDEIKNW